VIAGVLASVSAAITNIDTVIRFFAPSGAQLEIDDMDVVDGSLFPYVDIIIRNRGDKIATITSAKFIIDNIVVVPRGMYGGGLPIDEEYKVTIPVSESLPTSGTVEELARKVEKDDVDRIRFRYKLQPKFKKRPTSLFAFQLSVQLTYNGSKKVTAGPIVAIYNAPEWLLAFGSADDQGKVFYTQLAERIGRIKGKRSQEAERLTNFTKNYISKVQ
jgi:hypothetical protein